MEPLFQVDFFGVLRRFFNQLSWGKPKWYITWFGNEKTTIL